MTPLMTLKALVLLQEIDVRIRDQEKDKDVIPSRLSEIKAILGTRQSEINEERNLLDEAEMARRMAESDLKAEKEKIRKWETRLADIKTNRDYQALSRETEALRKANLGLEDEILRKMQEIEDLKVSIEQKQQEFDGQEKELLAERKDLEERLATINALIVEEQTIRETAQGKVDPRWHEQYQVIRRRRDGVAVVPVLDESCQGCHMGIPPQLYNVVLRGEQIEKCPFCHRIIYFKKAIDEISDDELVKTD